LTLKVAIIGGGINGLFISWLLSTLGHSVELYESSKVLKQTSSSSSKLLHGGIRYLEQGHLGLVKESLLDRSWWVSNAPQFARPIKICMPVYRDSQRSIVKLLAGGLLYRLLAGRYSLGPTSWKRKSRAHKDLSELNRCGLRGSVSFYDAQMNEESLGYWVRDKSREAGTKIFENTKVERFTSNGVLGTSRFGDREYDLIVNAAGPWVAQLNKDNKIDSNFSLTLIRGSHLILDRTINNPYLFQDPESSRVVFVLPYLGKTLVGTTEVTQSLSEEIICSEEERTYLLNIFNSRFRNRVDSSEIIREFSGLRPIVTPQGSFEESFSSSISREAAIESVGKLISVYGGKWTSAPSLSSKVVKEAEKLFPNS